MASCNLTCVPAKIDLQSPPDPEALLDKLDGLLKNCTTQEVERPYGDHYTKGLDELKKVTLC